MWDGGGSEDLITQSLAESAGLSGQKIALLRSLQTLILVSIMF